MFLTSFRVEEDEKEALLDVLLPLLPAGVHENGETLAVFSAVPFSRSALEAAAGRALDGWAVEEVPADWRARRALLGGGGVIVGERVSIRSPWDAVPAAALIDVVVERRGSAFGSGSHPTTQMCVALMLDLEPRAAWPISAAASGRWRSSPPSSAGRRSVAVDRVPVAIEVAQRERRAQRGRRRVCGRRSRGG